MLQNKFAFSERNFDPNIEARNAITGLLRSDGTHPHYCKAGDGGFNEYPSGTISLNKLNTRL